MLIRGLTFVLFALLMAATPLKLAFAQFTVTKTDDIDLGTAFAPATFSGTYYNLIGTNGTMQYASGYTGPATAIAGRLTITGATVGEQVQVSCESSGSTRNNAGCCGQASRAINQTRFVIGTSNAGNPGTGNTCQGLGTSPVTHTISATAANNVILVGGRMNVTNVKIGGQYTTNVGSGNPIRVRVRRVSSGTNYNTDVHWLASFDSSIAFSGTQNMQFGTISFGTIGASDRANLATNNAMTYAGGFSGSATGTAGFGTITGVENNVVLEVYCDTTATLTKAGGGSIQVTNIEVDPEDSRGAIGTGSACNGVAGAAAMTFTYTSATRDSVYIGGQLNGSTATSFGAGGSFSTANAGGNDIELIILNQ